jgi:hypothetical protein
MGQLHRYLIFEISLRKINLNDIFQIRLILQMAGRLSTRFPKYITSLTLSELSNP